MQLDPSSAHVSSTPPDSPPLLGSPHSARLGRALGVDELRAWVVAHQRDRALFLPTRRLVARFLARFSFSSLSDSPHSEGAAASPPRSGTGSMNLRTELELLRRARATTWELSIEQGEAEASCAPLDPLESAYYTSLGERLGLDRFQARAAALELNGCSLRVRRKVWEILYEGARPLPDSSSEGRRVLRAYAAIRAAGATDVRLDGSGCPASPGLPASRREEPGARLWSETRSSLV